jgi:phosphatidylinositol transfer protein SFH5
MSLSTEEVATASTETRQTTIPSGKAPESTPPATEKERPLESSNNKVQDETDKTVTAPVKEPLNSPAWPELREDHPLAQLLAKLPDLLSKSGHDEIYGIRLKTKSEPGNPDFHTLLILQKFLRANQNDLLKAEDQLFKTLQWRKQFDPIVAMNETFQSDKFNGLGKKYLYRIDPKNSCSTQDAFKGHCLKRYLVSFHSMSMPSLVSQTWINLY